MKITNRTIQRNLIVVTLLTVLSACTTSDPYSGDKKVRKSVKYGAAGAIACGIIGATRNSKSARNAALGCAAIGAGVGAYMDHQEAELREELQGTGVSVYRDGDQIQLVMPGNVTFNTDEYSIKSNFYPVLNSVSKVLYKFKDTQLDITGHTDSMGDSSYNQKLSNNRAYSVADYLAAQGVSGSRLRPKGMGENSPIASNDTATGRAQNRRVELFITPQPGG